VIAQQTAARDKVAKTEALARLGVARRERLDKADYDVYVSGLEGIPAAVVRGACERLARLPEPEFGPRFPTLATLLGVCRAMVDEQRVRRALAAPAAEPAAPERLAKFLEDIRAEIRRRDMP
jgi:hypothetical protein